MKPVRVGVIGFGFMGQTHVRAYQAAAADGLPVRLSAVADVSGEPLTGMARTRGNIDTGVAERLFDPASVATFGDAASLMASREVDAVSICTPTDTHAALAEQALGRGLHALIEKPVAVSAAAVRGLMDVERRTGKRAVPAMCIRYWPGWTWVRDRIADRSLGALLSLKCVRLGSRPDWSAFYADDARCGNAITDLHIHDADFITHAVGFPRAVHSLGTESFLTSAYRFDEPGLRSVQVTAEGGWLPTPGRGFRMRFVAEFEHATAEYDLARPTPLLLTRDGTTTPVDLPAGTGYDGQIRAWARWLSGQPHPAGEAPLATLAHAAKVLDLIDAEKRALRSGVVEAVRYAEP
jgi:predicted dehydrogenase